MFVEVQPVALMGADVGKRANAIGISHQKAPERPVALPHSKAPGTGYVQIRQIADLPASPVAQVTCRFSDAMRRATITARKTAGKPMKEA